MIIIKGSIVKKSSKYYIVIDLPRGTDGKRRQKWISNPLWKTKKLAEKDLPRVLTEAQDGIINIGSSVKLSDFLNTWHQYAQLSLRHNSLRSYQWAINHIKDGLGGQKLTAITTLHIQEFLRVKSETLSNTSLRTIFAVLRKSLDLAVDSNIIRINPCQKATRPSKQKYKPAVYGEPEIKQLIQAVKDTPAYIPTMIAIATGMRRSEIAALRWSDIDFKRHTLSVQNTFNESGPRGGLQPVKTGHSERVIMLPPQTIEMLSSLPRTSDYIMGRAYTPTHIWRCFKTAIKAAGLPDTRFQDLRHAHATYLIMNNVPIKTITERLGHHSTAFTMDTYGHVLRPMQEKAAAVVSCLFE